MQPAMKMKLILCGFAASLMFVQPGFAEDEDTPLAKQMEAMNDAYKAMRREEDPAKGAALAREAQDAMVKAITEIPELVKGMPDGPEKAKASAEFRKMMGSLISTLASMELAFLDKDLDKVKEIVDAMRELKKEGHDKFMEDE
jgi:soluble cytochrome b562